MDNVLNAVKSYATACGILNALVCELLISDNPVPNATAARLLVEQMESNIEEMPQSMLWLRDKLKEKYRL